MTDLARPPRVMLLALMAGSGLLLGLSFPPSPLYTLAYVGFVPLLILLESLQRGAQVFRYGYGAMVVLHAVSLYWVGGFTHGNDPYLMISGVALVFGHPLFFTIPLLLFHGVRKQLGSTAALILFPFLWTSFEYSRSVTEFAFPWITIGNSQAYDLARIQIAEYSSVYGLSALIALFNVLATVLLRKLAASSWTIRSRQSILMLGAMVLLYVLPWVYGTWMMDAVTAGAPGEAVRVGVVQPNIDPWEKWGDKGPSRWVGYHRQYLTYLSESEQFRSDSVDLIVWPETALPFDPLLSGNTQYAEGVKDLTRRLEVSVFSGMPSYVMKPSVADSAERKYLVYNAATLLTPDSVFPVYKKVVLVPFAERVPYAEVLTFLVEPLRWGVGISGWDKGSDPLVYPVSIRTGAEARFGGMICYESIFPWYVREFVLAGAEFLVVITNDSWWGKTSGAYQHAAIASLRAVEQRRWIVRCANGGISGFVDPAGRYHQETALYTSARLTGVVTVSRELTFYARYGDLFAQGCSAVTVAFLMFTLVRTFTRKNRRDFPSNN